MRKLAYQAQGPNQPLVAPGVLDQNEIEALRGWLDAEAVTVPEGWLEACLEWLSEQSDSQMTPQQLREAVYQQWLHSDFCQLGCAILPDHSNMTQETLLLEGELCLQISGVINIGQSYYGQLRTLEGKLGKDVPDLEFDQDFSEIEGASIDPSFQLSTIQHSQPSSRLAYPQSSLKTYALHLTDGVNTVKAVEVGSKYLPTATPPEEWFRVGAKVKLRGPLKLRKGVLTLPSGTISNASAIAHLPNSQFCLLGGEVDFADGSDGRMDHLLQRELLKKLNLPLDNPPKWFPGRRNPPTPAADVKTSPKHPSAQQPGGGEVKEAEPLLDEDDLLLASAVDNFENLGDDAAVTTADDRNSKEEDPFEGDELLLSAVENFESQTASVSRGAIGENKTASTMKERRGKEVEDEIEDALQDIDFSPQLDISTFSAAAVTSCKRFRVSPPQEPTIQRQAQPREQPKPSPKIVKRTLRSCNSDIRRFLSATTGNQQIHPQQRSETGAEPLMPPFAYLQDIYYKLQRRGSGTEVCLIRGMLVSVQSRLEHHEGRRWSLTVCLSDGTATVDADMEDELLRTLIGLSAIEAEAIRRLGSQGDGTQKQRLKEIISAFQLKLCHMSGLFEMIFPNSAASSSSTSNPRIRRFRSLDQQWLSYLKSRAS